jgi:hypothetical protein
MLLRKQVEDDSPVKKTLVFMFARAQKRREGGEEEVEGIRGVEA